MLVEKTLFGVVDKVEQAIARIKLHEPKEGYYVAFSGGKDSVVILDLVKRVGVKFDAHYNITTVDPPELVYFIRRECQDVIMEKPPKSMWKLIEENEILPLRQVRYCCRVLKERGGMGRTVVTGVRAQESTRRSKRKMFEKCIGRSKQFLHPIFEWSESEVWEYIKKYNIKYCKLYDEGFKRIGCVGCPMANKETRLKQFERYPQIKKAYIKACERAIEKRKRLGKTIYIDNAEDMFNRWINETPVHSGGAKCSLHCMDLMGMKLCYKEVHKMNNYEIDFKNNTVLTENGKAIMCEVVELAKELEVMLSQGEKYCRLDSIDGVNFRVYGYIDKPYVDMHPTLSHQTIVLGEIKTVLKKRNENLLEILKLLLCCYETEENIYRTDYVLQQLYTNILFIEIASTFHREIEEFIGEPIDVLSKE